VAADLLYFVAWVAAATIAICIVAAVENRISKGRLAVRTLLGRAPSVEEPEEFCGLARKGQSFGALDRGLNVIELMIGMRHDLERIGRSGILKDFL
jgi:hypothetical protein